MRKYKFIARVSKPLMGLVGHVIKNDADLSPKIAMKSRTT